VVGQGVPAARAALAAFPAKYGRLGDFAGVGNFPLAEPGALTQFSGLAAIDPFADLDYAVCHGRLLHDIGQYSI
jgi:hypothetical protein